MAEPTAQDLKARFETAAAQAQKLPRKPDDNTLLLLYALYKQATVGDVSGSRPGFTDLKGRAKYDAWTKQKGKSANAAMQAYIALVDRLKG